MNNISSKEEVILRFFPLINLWEQRSLVLHFAVLNIKMRYKSTYFGILWSALEPLLYFTVLYVVFTSIRGQDENFAIYLITGIMLFHLFVRGTIGGLGSLITNESLIISINIKREFFPVVATVGAAILAFVDVGVFFAMMPVFGFTPSWTIVLIPLPLILLFGLILGLSYFLSITTVYVRDVAHLWNIFSHSLLFISPIFWNLNNVSGILVKIQKVNPLGQIIELAHKLVIEGIVPPLNEWIYTTSFVLAILFVSYFIFHILQKKIPEEL